MEQTINGPGQNAVQPVQGQGFDTGQVGRPNPDQCWTLRITSIADKGTVVTEACMLALLEDIKEKEVVLLKLHREEVMETLEGQSI